MSNWKLGKIITVGLVVLSVAIILISKSSHQQLESNIHIGPEELNIFSSGIWLNSSQHTDVQIKFLELSLWPEYDRESVLVIQKLILSTEFLEKPLSISVPKNIEDLSELVEISESGKIKELEYEVSEQKTEKNVTFRPSHSQIQFEYYDPQLFKHGNERNYVYHWSSEYSIGSVILRVQRPMHARNISIVPNMGTGEIQSDGMEYFTTVHGFTEKNHDLDITIFYDNPSGKLSIPNSSNEQEP